MHPNEELFLQLIRGLQREFDVEFEIKGHLPMFYNAQVNLEGNRKVLEYSRFFLRNAPETEVIHAALHELGHILTIPDNFTHYFAYFSFEARENAEYMAERFALDYLKVNFPHDYKVAPKWWAKAKKDMLLVPEARRSPMVACYINAFSRIPEYQDC